MKLFVYLFRNLFRVPSFLCYEGHSIYIGCLNKDSLVVDLGANRGYFSSEINKDYGCKCIAIEPVPHLYDSITENEQLKKFNLAVCKKSGPVKFFLSKNPTASSLISDVSDAGGAMLES